MIGKKPNFKAIKATWLTTTPRFIIMYQQMLKAINAGDFSLFNSIVAQNTKFLKETNLLLVLQSKCPILIVRNLFKRIWTLSSKPLTLNYDTLVALMRLTGFDFSIDDLLVENLLVSLIDQNLLKGKIFPRLRVVSLAKSNVFPPVDQINFIRFGNGDENTLSSSDRWLMS
jgi:hypothetical protein